MTVPIDLSDWLVGRGLTRQQADLWSDFIVAVLDLIEEGHRLLRSPSEWSSFLGGCHGSKPTEPEITSGLGDRMRRLRGEADIGTKRDRIDCAYEVPTPGDHSHGIRKSKADFRFDLKYEAGYTMSFVFEAKPLWKNNDLKSRYLGGEGLGCFTIRKPPYSEERVAGMIGYMRANASDWQDRLAKALEALSPLRFDNVRTGQRVLLASDHDRPNTTVSPVTVLHTLLDFSGV